MDSDIQLIIWVQETFGPGARSFFRFFNILWGDFNNLIPALVFWLGGSQVGFRAGFFMWLSGICNEYLKWGLAQPRPFYVSDAFSPLKVSDGFGMPSGNAQRYATLVATLVYRLRSFLWWGMAAVVIFFGGLARLYFGLHSASQVLVDWLLGLMIVVILLKIEQPMVTWFRRFSVSSQLLLVALVSGLIMATGYLIGEILLASFEAPAVWIERFNQVAQQLGVDEEFGLFYTPASFLFGGVFLGYALTGIYFLRRGLPTINTRAAKLVNVITGLYFLCLLLKSLVSSFVTEVIFFTTLPLLLFVITPWLSARLMTWRSAGATAQRGGK